MLILSQLEMAIWHQCHSIEFGSLSTFVKGTNGNLHHSVNVWWDETFFPCREKGDRRITSVSVGRHANSKDIEDIFSSSPKLVKYNSKCLTRIKIV